MRLTSFDRQCCERLVAERRQRLSAKQDRARIPGVVEARAREAGISSSTFRERINGWLRDHPEMTREQAIEAACSGASRRRGQSSPGRSPLQNAGQGRA